MLRHVHRQRLVMVFAGLGGFLFGYDTGVVSGAVPYLEADLMPGKAASARAWLIGVVVSSAIWGAALGAVMGGRIADNIGRKRAMAVADGLFIAGSLCMALAPSVSVVICGRILVGLGVGIASAVVPVFLAETSQAEHRAGTVAANVVMITTGQLISFIVNYALSHVRGTWRWMLGVAALPALVQLLGLGLLPESPRWLLSKLVAQLYLDKIGICCSRRRITSVQGRVLESRAAAGLLFSPRVVASIMSSIQDEVASGNQRQASLFDAFRSAVTRSQLCTGVMLQVLQQLAGINTVMYFLPVLLKQGGIKSNQMALLYSCFPAAVNSAGSIVGMKLIDRAGRRKLLLSSLAAVVAALITLVVCFRLADDTSPMSIPLPDGSDMQPCSVETGNCADCITANCVFCLDGLDGSAEGWCLASAGQGACAHHPLHDVVTDGCPSPYRHLLVLALMGYLLAFSVGMGPVPWAVNAEIYPLHVRGLASGLAGTANWITNGFVSQTFLVMVHAFRASGAFGAYAAVAALGWLWAFVFLPETKGLTLDQVQRLFVTKYAQGSPCRLPLSLNTDAEDEGRRRYAETLDLSPS